jgi:lysophospholipase L1-like esterase
MMLRTRTHLALLGLLITTPTSLFAAGKVGWNYDGIGDDTLGPAEVAGVVPYAQSNWNNHAGIGQAPGNVPFSLKDNDGADTDIKVTGWTQSSNNSYSYNYTSPNSNEKLMNSFADQNPAVTFSNIPANYRDGRYTVVVYYGNNEGSSTSTLNLAGSGNDERSRTIKTGPTASSSYRLKGFLEGTDANSSSVSNYSVFTGLNDASFTVSLAGANNNGFHAVQIIAENGPPIPESTDPVTPAIPANGATNFKPWQPISWNAGGEGELNYDLYLWTEGSTKPVFPTATVSRLRYIPSSYLLPNQAYRWQVVTHHESGENPLTSPEYTFTTTGLTGQPAFDISADAKPARTAAVDAMKGLNLLVTKNGGSYPLPNNTRLAFYGDSITDVFTYFDGIQTALQQAKSNDASFPNVTVLNRGINGATTDDLLNLPDGDQFAGGSGPNPPLKFKEQVDADIAALPVGATYVAVFQIGINDVYQGDNTSKSVYKARMLEMADYVLGKGHKVVLASPTVMNESPISDIVNDGIDNDAGNSLINQYVVALQEIAEERGVPFVNQRAAYLNIYKNENVSLATDGTVAFPQTTGILNSDIVHPNARGKALSSELVAKGIYEAFSVVSAPGEINVTPTSLNFPSQSLEIPSSPVAVTIQNQDPTNNLAISGLTITGANAADFSVTGSAGTVPPSGQVQVQVIFTPKNSGPRTATLQIQSNDSDEPTVSVTLQGTGLAVAPSAPTGPTPANSSTGISTTQTLSWSAATGAAGYDVYLWKSTESEPGTPTAQVTTTSYSPAPLSTGTTYRWKVAARNAAGATPSPTWSFKTEAVAVIESIGWNYDNQNRSNDTVAPTALAGAPGYAQLNWNNHTGAGQGPATSFPFALKDSTGATTTAQVTAWTQRTGNSWSYGYAGTDPNGMLMNSFADTDPRITFSNIPASYTGAGYSVVVYYGNNEGPNVSDLAIAGSGDDTRTRRVRTGAITQSGWENVGYVEGTDVNSTTSTNFSVFTNLNDPGFTVSLLPVGGNNNNGIMAVQIVKNSAPPSEPGYGDWAETNGLIGDDAAFDADPDHDGLSNGIEFVLGGQPNPASPNANSSGLLNPVQVVGDNLVFTFTRSHAASSIETIVEFSTTLNGEWTAATELNATIETDPGEESDTVTVTIPKGGESKLFARLRAVEPAQP